MPRTQTPSQLASFANNKNGLLTGKHAEFAAKIIGFVANVNSTKKGNNDEK
jgi:hypothetical protein